MFGQRGVIGIMLKHLKITLCTFTALWLPVIMFTSYFELPKFQAAVASLGEWPLYLMIAGLISIIVDLWRSPMTQDDKIWWTALGVFLAPVVVPAYWFGFGLQRNRTGSVAAEPTICSTTDGK